MSTLYLVPTPIGNLRDITLRAIDVMNEADLIICEDTRQTAKLLKAHDIKRPMQSYHEHSGGSKAGQLLERLEAGEKLALVSDGGTPLISDPGFKLVGEAIKRGFEVVALPGATAITAALVASGLATDSFAFHGFLPVKSAARRKILASLTEHEETLVFYESPFRLVKALRDMAEVLGNREAAVARELTKKFEEVSRGNLADLVRQFEKKAPKGEIVVLIAGKGRKKVLV